MSERLERFGIAGCGDSSCYIAKPTGMHTNGGCRCPPSRLWRIIQRLQAEAAPLAAAIPRATSQFETGDCVVEYQDDAAAKTKVFEKLIAYFKEHRAFSGESIMQRDGPQIDAAPLLSEIADEVIQFKLTRK